MIEDGETTLYYTLENSKIYHEKELIGMQIHENVRSGFATANLLLNFMHSPLVDRQLAIHIFALNIGCSGYGLLDQCIP